MPCANCRMECREGRECSEAHMATRRVFWLEDTPPAEEDGWTGHALIWIGIAVIGCLLAAIEAFNNAP